MTTQSLESNYETQSWPRKNYYEILGLNTDYTIPQLDKIYKLAALKLHPDKHPEETQKYTVAFQELGKIYDTLRTPEQRKHYEMYIQSLGGRVWREIKTTTPTTYTPSPFFSSSAPTNSRPDAKPRPNKRKKFPKEKTTSGKRPHSEKSVQEEILKLMALARRASVPDQKLVTQLWGFYDNPLDEGVAISLKQIEQRLLSPDKSSSQQSSSSTKKGETHPENKSKPTRLSAADLTVNFIDSGTTASELQKTILDLISINQQRQTPIPELAKNLMEFYNNPKKTGLAELVKAAAELLSQQSEQDDQATVRP